MGTNVASIVNDGSLIGLGSGSAVAAFVHALGLRISQEKLSISGIPSSIQIERIAKENGIKLETSSRMTDVEIVVDGADQIDSEFNMIKGGGGALFREKVLIESSKRRIIVADESKYSDRLTRTVPLEVTEYSRHFVADSVRALGGNPTMRSLEKGYPYFTQNGNMIFETDFGRIEDPRKLQLELLKIPGIIANGIFTMPIDSFFKAKNDGSVEEIRP